MNTTTSLEKIKGVGPKTAEQFAAAGLTTVGDLVRFLPRKHEDFTEVVKIAEIHPGKATIKARSEKISTRPVRRGLRLTTAVLADETGKLQAVWFNQPYRVSQLGGGEKFYFSGEFEFSYNRYQLTNPSAEKVSDMPVQTDRLLPIYPAIRGLKSQLVRKILAELKPLMTMLPETLPESVVRSEGLTSYGEALLGMHFPSEVADIEHARERLAFEELFEMLLAALLNKQENNALTGWKIPFDQPTIRKFVGELPFALTNAQRRAAWQILQDFESGVPMNRLLQGDVGSGKTVVAGLAARQAAQAGLQTAIMAPTEILASQHAETLAKLLTPFGVNVALFTGSVKGAARKELLEHLRDGTIDVIVGTHALIQKGVDYHRLGFVAIDEQHRFGVKQRQALLDKSKHLPHLLAMTATPIPRSLALTLYGELEVSILDELPAGRQPISTKIWAPTNTEKLYALVDGEIAKGRQAYIICSLIDENPDNDKKSVEAEYKKLQSTVFRHCRVGLLHGRLSAEDKESVMRQFADGELDILVSTTVVEVGVDVPNATVMVIENADQFGLSQLHQLRGRVGRGQHKSYCYLVMTGNDKPSQRLREIESSQDGFYLAEVDLKLRGPGEIYGRAQHGALNLQIATLADTKLIARARAAAERYIDSGEDMVQYTHLAQAVERYRRLTTLN